MANTQTTLSADNTPIAFETIGTGPAVVIVDGALCYREFGDSRNLATELSPHFTVYFYDRRGRGESGNTLPYSREREVEDLAAVVAATREIPFVAGFSSGGGLALEAAASGVPIRKVAVYEAPYLGNRGSVDDAGHLQALIDRGDRGAAVKYFMVKMVGAPIFLPLVLRFMPRVWKQLTAIAHTLPYDATIMRGFVVPTARLGTITTPTLVMGGGKAKPAMTAAVDAVARAIPGSEKRTLSGQTHQVAASAIVPELVRFFAGTPIPSETATDTRLEDK